MSNQKLRVHSLQGLSLTTFMYINHTLDLLFSHNGEYWDKFRLSTGDHIGAFDDPDTTHPDTKGEFFHPDTHIMKDNV